MGENADPAAKRACMVEGVSESERSEADDCKVLWPSPPTESEEVSEVPNVTNVPVVMFEDNNETTQIPILKPNPRVDWSMEHAREEANASSEDECEQHPKRHKKLSEPMKSLDIKIAADYLWLSSRAILSYIGNHDYNNDFTWHDGAWKFKWRNIMENLYF